MSERKNSEARIKANNKYGDKAYDRINTAIPKGKKQIIQDHVTLRGETVNGFMNRAIDETLKNDVKKNTKTTKKKEV